MSMNSTDKYLFRKGLHTTAADGRCAMEWFSYLAGELHSDSPVCVCPTLKAFCIGFNDALPDSQRQRLRPFLARTIGTAGDGLAEHRSWLATDWLIRSYTPAWLSLAGLDDEAQRLRLLSPVLAAESLKRAMVDLTAARESRAAARAAAWDAARDAAWDAAWNAARDAARNAAWGAAWNAAWGAAWDAAWDAAAAAAGAAAGGALIPTVEALQESAFDLLDRMLPTVAIQIPVAVDADLVCAL